MKEEDLYKPVADFIEREFNCFYLDMKKGIELGTVDVVGLRYVMGDYGGSTEVIAVEVKPEEMTFLKCAGQAHAYSVMADRCYLAIQKRYGRTLTQNQRDVAAQLQIGLIEIGKGKRCRVVVSSPEQRPIRAHKLELIGKCGFVECVICGSLFEDKAMRSMRERSNITHAIRDEKGFRYWLMDLYERRGLDDRKYVYDRRHICRDCVQIFSGFWKDKNG
jgi:hypothetical protein